MELTEEDFLSAMNQPVVNDICFYAAGALMRHVNKGRTRLEACALVKAELEDLTSLNEALERAVNLSTDGGNFTQEEAAWFVERMVEVAVNTRFKEYYKQD